jgi:threonine synthase
MMKYISTRGISRAAVSSATAIKQGLASDGGLFMPTEIPKINIDFLEKLASLSYPERCAEILSLFLSDYSYNEILEDAVAAYNEEKFAGGIAPVREIYDGVFMLELWHGPTSAFKDMALQIMPRLFTRAMKKCGEKRSALILVATSGDTGKAALEGYKDIDGVLLKVFYPTDGVSAMQKLQMQTQTGANLSVSAIRGNFDDAQSRVKEIFSSAECNKVLEEDGVFLSSANSINFGRLVPQIVYYFSAYVDMYKCGNIALGEKIDVVVPTGNSGNIFAAFVAKMMGLPIDKLVCASNKNDVLCEFLRTGRYNSKRPFYTTSSPSMDILISSNLERLLYVLFGQERCAELMAKFADTCEYQLTDEELSQVQEHFLGYSATDEEGARLIKKTYEERSSLIDTHTAVALVAAEKYAMEYKAENSILAVSTASPYKFAHEVLLSIFGIEENAISAPDVLEGLTKNAMPEPIASIRKKEIIHKEIIDKTDMWKSTLDFVRLTK